MTMFSNALNALLSTQLKKILKGELHNSDRMNVYSVGEYWAAFDKSAFLLNRLAPGSVESMPLNIKGYPFPLIMSYVHYPVIDEMCHNHVMSKRNMEFIQFMSEKIDRSTYERWYDDIVNDDDEDYD